MSNTFLAKYFYFSPKQFSSLLEDSWTLFLILYETLNTSVTLYFPHLRPERAASRQQRKVMRGTQTTTSPITHSIPGQWRNKHWNLCSLAVTAM